MNNDRFKFRVWDETRKKYWGKEEWDEKTKRYYDDNYVYLGTDGRLREYHFGDVCLFDKPGQIVEQCTGLKDKNGNLIYIGDIIKCGNGPLSTATVQYENGENFIDGIYPFNLYHDCGDECHCQLRDYPEYACEIIGNIHEQKGNK